MKQKVIVALSGGVDSSVAAYRLLDAGYRVEGLFMKNWEEEDTERFCRAREDREDAQKVCDQLKIPLHCANFSGEYWDKVFEKFLAFLQAGLTPNPDVWCNSLIKFDDCLQFACQHLHASQFATGHYARLRQVEGTYRLFKALDPSKDQSYFLHALNQSQLAKSLFPLGDLLKSQVRTLARQLGLATANKPDSMGICFIGPRRFRDFIANYFSYRPGEICTPEGEVIGEHKGLHFYTIGQRRGLGIGGIRQSEGSPWYVIQKSLRDNRLIVTQNPNHPLLCQSAFRVGHLHWIASHNEQLDQAPLTCTLKTRSQQTAVPAQISWDCTNRTTIQVSTESPQRAVTPGQFAVFYQGEEVLGGGIIENDPSLAVG